MTARNHLLSFGVGVAAAAGGAAVGGAVSAAVAAAVGGVAALAGVAVSAAGAAAVGGVAVAAAVALAGVAVAAGAAVGGVGGGDFKPASFIAGLFTGLAAVGSVVYALEGEPGRIAALDTPPQGAALDSYGKPLATAFEDANGRRAVLTAGAAQEMAAMAINTQPMPAI